MGVILDSSILIAAERRRFELRRLFEDYPDEEFFIAAVTASELLHGVERAHPAARKAKRKRVVEHYLDSIAVVDFDLPVARIHARIWAKLEAAGRVIGAHDLIIAATALYLKNAVVTLNRKEFSQVSGLKLVPTARYTPARN
jgi:tRNA(fMet)-specific endonuclease VapC